MKRVERDAQLIKLGRKKERKIYIYIYLHTQREREREIESLERKETVHNGTLRRRSIIYINP
jgi:hypothetical protein